MELEAIFSKLTEHTPVIMGSSNASKYAVMLPMVKKEDGVHVLFEVRSQELRRQPGEICFPGGKIDEQDESEKAAAIRETMEELGLKKEEITDVTPLNYIISPFGMIVFPFVGFITRPEKINVNTSEVGEIFTVPLSHFIKTNPEIYRINFNLEPEENFPFHLISGGKNYNWRIRAMDEYFYFYKGKTIWGLTAKILEHFVEVIR